MKVSKSRRKSAQSKGQQPSYVTTGCAGAVLVSTLVGGVPVAVAQDGMVIEEVVVNARRREESAQDVSVSMSVFNQKQLDEANITNPSDLATYTPSLQANNRFGGDNTTFAIRGFSQELRTTASVGVYFAEVVAPRGANAQQSGDGASPGDMFDLASVQVLKGPQGTLFGRNTTGGAVLIFPKKPTQEFDGYVEITHGNYDLWREQAVVNVPVTDTFALRFGVDHQERDGYLDNISNIGPEDFADSKYTSFRLSTLWDVTDRLENYTIFKHTDSDNNGYPGSVFGCYEGTSPFGAALANLYCKPDLQRRAAAGTDGFYDIYNSIPDPVNEQKLSQVVNTLTYQINDDITLKNILAYSTLETYQRSSLFGENWVASSGDQVIFQQVGLADGLPTTDQDTFVAELQIQGSSFDQRFTWQAGLYYEKSEPGKDSGSQSPALIACDQDSIAQLDPNLFSCYNLESIGRLAKLEGGVEYTNQAVYFEGSYDLTDAFKFTLGLRYTNDETEGYVTETVYNFSQITYSSPVSNGVPPAFPTYVPPVEVEYRDPAVKSEEPTWLLGLEYRPTDAVMLYTKYARGYRQGSVNIAGTTGFDTHKPEKVDTYEIGAKTQFEWVLPGTFNIAAFYNDFQDQQIQYGYFKPSNVGTTAITNAGKSTIWGVEADGSVMLPGNFILTASYSHLDTEVKELDPPTFPPGFSSLLPPSTTTAEGEPLSLVPKNQFVGTLAWMVPVSPEIGDMKLAVTYVFTDTQQGVAQEYSVFAVFPQYELWNLNYSWDAIFGSNFDFSAFVTNLKDEEYITYIAGTYNNGIEAGAVGQPKMIGARIKYNFVGF